MNKTETLKNRLHALREKYRAALPARAAALRSIWQRLRAACWDAGIAGELGAEAHRLAGSGQTFGLPTLSEMALTVDTACAEMLRKGGQPDASALLDLERAIGRLLEAMDQAHVAEPFPDTDLQTNPQPGCGGTRVAVIDDDPDLREHLALVLRADDYQVTTFVSPEQALMEFVREPPDIIILDLMFPGRFQPALDTIGDIRSVAGSHVDVVVISALTDFATRASVARAGANLFLSKPVGNTELLAAVGRLAQARRSRALRCLVVEDDELLLEQIRQWLVAAGIEAFAAITPRQAWASLEDFHPDVVLSDINLQECSGIDLVTMLRQNPGFTRLPVVFMTADPSHETRQRALLTGAEDYLQKPLDRTALVESVRRRGRAGHQLREQLEFLVKQVAVDGGMSRHFFYAELQDAMKESSSSDKGRALVVCALDEAAVASLNGQDIDRAAISWHFSRRVRAVGARQWTMLGDFTAALLLDADRPAEHLRVAETLKRAVSGEPFMVGDKPVSAAAHLSLLHLANAEGIAASVALAQAEQLLSIAEADQGVVEGYLSTKGGSALPSTEQFEDRLSLAFQPVVTIDGSGAPGSSVYLRMRDEHGTLQPATSFIADIRRQGVLPGVDAWVIRSSLARLVNDSGEALFLITQISEESLHNDEFMLKMEEMLAQEKMPDSQHCLVVGVTERAAIACRQAVTRLNDLLRQAGCALMLLDYGSTRESVALVESLQPLFVRLSGDVRQRLSDGGPFVSADRTLIDVANTNNAALVAGGVESAGALSALWSRGVRRFQGYFIQAPAETLMDS